jgi:ribosomal-protein-alanine N-acetyltransferase
VYPVKIEGPRIALREFADADASALHGIYGDPTVTRHLSFEPRTLDQVKAIISGAVDDSRREPRTVYMLAAIQRNTDELVGSARLAIDERPHSAQIGFAIGAGQWRLGLGTETVNLLLRFGFGELGLHRIWAARSPENLASDVLLRKVGFVEEGRIRHHVGKQGNWRDSITYSILDDEWNP